MILCIKGFVDDLEKKILASKEAFAKQTTDTIEGQIKGFVDDLEKKVLASKEAIAKQTTNAIEGQIKTLYIDSVESKDRENRKNNIIMFGVPESSTEEDEAKAKEILQKVSDKDIDIVSVTRLRTKNGIKPFPLRVKLKEEKDKWKVISKSASLAQMTGYMKRVYIKRDMTRREREEDQALRSELKERRMKSVQDADGARWIIRKGRVINLTREKKCHRSGTPPRNTDQIHLNQARRPNQTRKRNVVNPDSKSEGRVSPHQHHSSASDHNTPHRESVVVDVHF